MLSKMEQINKMEALNSRGLDLGELLSLLPAAIKATANISEQIKLTKQGQKPAVTVANVLNSTILVLNQAMSDADLTPEQLKVYQKIIAYVTSATAAIVTIEARA